MSKLSAPPTASSLAPSRLRKGARLAQKVDYPAFGLLGSHTFDSTLVSNAQTQCSVGQSVGWLQTEQPPCVILFQTGDKKLAHSAQMYHYQQQKQQMLSLER